MREEDSDLVEVQKPRKALARSKMRVQPQTLVEYWQREPRDRWSTSFNRRLDQRSMKIRGLAGMKCTASFEDEVDAIKVEPLALRCYNQSSVLTSLLTK
jgi:hypothetical protein